MGKPAGVQLRRWFTFMVMLLIFVNIAAVGISVVINSAVKGVVADYQPFAIATGDIEKHITMIQRDMYRYIYTGAGAKDPTLADQQLDAILDEMDKLMSRVAKAKEIATDERSTTMLEAISTRSEQYRNAIDALAYAIGDTVNFDLLKELLAQANSSGNQVMQSAADLSAEATKEILERNSRAAMLTSFAMYLFIAVFIASLVVLAILQHWWKRFQDVMLGL